MREPWRSGGIRLRNAAPRRRWGEGRERLPHPRRLAVAGEKRGEPRPMHARAYWATAAGRGEIRRLALRRPGPGEVLVRALPSAASRGTEALVPLGRVPPSQHAAM